VPGKVLGRVPLLPLRLLVKIAKLLFEDVVVPRINGVEARAQSFREVLDVPQGRGRLRHIFLPNGRMVS